MGGRSSRNKGNTFERDTAEVFSNRFNQKFRRVPLSGGWDKTQVQGDIFNTEARNFKLVIECKNHKTLSVPAWWKQVQADTPPDKLPLLVFKIFYRTHMTKTNPFEEWIQGSFSIMRQSDFLSIYKPNRRVDKRIKRAMTYSGKTISIAKILFDFTDTYRFMAFIDTEMFSGTRETFVLLRTNDLLVNIDENLCYI
jgi:hypothetical protein